MSAPSVCAVPPGAEFLGGIGVSSWVEPRGGQYPCLLVTGQAPEAERGLRVVARRMLLAPVAARPVRVGLGRLYLCGGVVAVDYGHPDCLLRVPRPGPWWLSRAAALGAVRVTVGLDPLRAGAGRDEVGAYLERVSRSGRGFVGVCATVGGDGPAG